jgi:hypothetical protein
MTRMAHEPLPPGHGHGVPLSARSSAGVCSRRRPCDQPRGHLRDDRGGAAVRVVFRVAPRQEGPDAGRNLPAHGEDGSLLRDAAHFAVY